MPDELWKRSIEERTKRLRDRLASLLDLSEAISDVLASDDCPVDAAVLRIERQSPFSPIKLGYGRADSFTHMVSDSLDNNTAFCLETWKKPMATGTDAEQFNRRIVELAEAFWKADLRSEVSRLILRSNAERQHLIDKTILALLAENAVVTLFYTDIDDFKNINTVILHDPADGVIRQLAAFLEDAFAPNGIVFHRSGDEFAVLLPGDDPNQALTSARDFMAALAAHNFDPRINPVGSKMGITSIRKSDLDPTYGNFEPQAETATTGPGGAVYRGRARFFLQTTPRYPALDARAFSSAICAAKTRVAFPAPFSNPWLNLISAEACLIAKADISASPGLQSRIDLLLSWIGATIDDKILCTGSSNEAPILAAEFSHLDIVIAVFHGVMHANLNRAPALCLSLQHSDTFETVRLCSDQHGEIYFSGAGSATTQVYDLGTAPISSTETTARLLSPAVLMRIGNAALGSESLFADVITIDDRPTEGGGLPDFWEAALARLITQVKGDQAISDVFVVGNRDHAKETIARLEEIDEWHASVAKLSYKTGQSQQDIQDCATRLHGHIHYSASAANLLAELEEVLKAPHVFQEQPRRRADDVSAYALEREMPSSAYALHREDGVRVETIGKAYPIVLEVVRKAVDAGLTLDQAQIPLKELLDFKVTLSQPTTQMCPVFYSAEASSLENYFDRVFVQPKGLFRSRLDENGQLDAVVAHVAEIISRPESERYNTRRAILVVPHEVIAGKDLAPIGLVSVRVIPRFLRAKTILHFSYSWRTVEAIVGFPYSIYASVRFSEHLVELVARKLADSQRRNLELGTVAYIAHSLHFFLNTYGQSIARHIVNEASA